MDDLEARVTQGLDLYRALRLALRTSEGWTLRVGHIEAPATVTAHRSGVLFEAALGALPEPVVVELLQDGIVMHALPFDRHVGSDDVTAVNLTLELEGASA